MFVRYRHNLRGCHFFYFHFWPIMQISLYVLTKNLQQKWPILEKSKFQPRNFFLYFSFEGLSLLSSDLKRFQNRIKNEVWVNFQSWYVLIPHHLIWPNFVFILVFWLIFLPKGIQKCNISNCANMEKPILGHPLKSQIFRLKSTTIYNKKGRFLEKSKFLPQNFSKRAEMNFCG